MKAIRAILLFSTGVALLVLYLSNSRWLVSAQSLPSAERSGFLRSLNSQDFFKQGRVKLEKEIEHMDEFSQLSSKQVLQVTSDAPVQEKDVRELEPKQQRQGEGKR